MGTVSPWSVKGVEPDAREAAKAAARRAGVTVGQWLSGTIRAAADRPATGDGATAPPDDRRSAGRDDISAREAEAAAQRARVVAELSAASMERALQRLVERIDRIAPAGGSDGSTDRDRRWSASIGRAD